MEQTQSLREPIGNSPQTSPCDNKMIFIVTLFFLLFAVTVVAVYYIYKTKQLKTQISENNQQENQATTIIQPTPRLTTAPSPASKTNLKTFKNEKYGFEFSYPSNWKLGTKQGNDQIILSDIRQGHRISIMVWEVTGFGYCYQYQNRKEIMIDERLAEIADGVGETTPMCEKDMTNKANTYVLIPYDQTTTPATKIHLSYDYPLDEYNLAQDNLEKIISSFRIDR